MGTKSPGGPQRCRLILKHCIAVQLSKPGHTLDDFWMYDSGYMVFQVSFYFPTAHTHNLNKKIKIIHKYDDSTF